MITREELDNIYMDYFPKGMTYNEVTNKLSQLENHQYINELRGEFCNQTLYGITLGYTRYKEEWKFEESELVAIFCQNVEKLPENYYFYKAVYYFFKHKKQECMDCLRKSLESSYEADKNVLPEDFLNEASFVDVYVEPFKNAFEGFWTELKSMLIEMPVTDAIVELCQVFDEFYKAKTNEEVVDLLITYLQNHPESIVVKELLADTYYSMKEWNNSIAYFEAIEDRNILFTSADIFFMMAWCYGKSKDCVEEEKYYRKCLEQQEYVRYTRNNLGYTLYKQKKYNEAKKIFEDCLAENIELPYAANNYVRVLIAMGRNKDAKQFIKEGKFKISKSLRDKVSKLDSSNARIKKDNPIIYDEKDSDAAFEVNAKYDGNRHQFSNEKLLEDELTARIESGVSVFGLNLKVYKRRGEYGRQYVIPVGRIDLLCEDKDGNLYIIELKKDSGYDDAYLQIKKYLDWFEKSKFAGEKKVYGIICLNSPSKELIDKVHNDERIKLFEYQISYREL